MTLSNKIKTTYRQKRWRGHGRAHHSQNQECWHDSKVEPPCCYISLKSEKHNIFQILIRKVRFFKPKKSMQREPTFVSCCLPLFCPGLMFFSLLSLTIWFIYWAGSAWFTLGDPEFSAKKCQFCTWTTSSSSSRERLVDPRAAHAPFVELTRHNFWQR